MKPAGFSIPTASQHIADMNEPLVLTYEIDGDDFTCAGDASANVKRKLRWLGMPPDVVRRVSIAMYEGEINMVLHANGGKAIVTIFPNYVQIELIDKGPGIPNVELAMKEGYSTASERARDLGFGAGMGLPNMKRYTDEMSIETEIGKGTTIRMIVYLAKKS